MVEMFVFGVRGFVFRMGVFFLRGMVFLFVYVGGWRFGVLFEFFDLG